MQRFLELIDTIKANGIVGCDSRGKPRIFIAGAKEWDYIERCQPFVFQNSATEGEVQELPNTEKFGGITIEDIDAPFPVFSIEVLNGILGVGEALESNPMSINKYEDIKRQVEILCVVVMEQSPKTYLFLTLLQNGDTRQVTASNAEGNLVKKYMDMMNRQKIGSESVKTSIKIGSGKSKRTHRIRRIIHVAPNKYVKEQIVKGSKEVNWTHRFEVRGHWVSIPGSLGKDREGNYCVKDFTWRSNYIKGDEKLPLIKKVRIVEGEKDGTTQNPDQK